MKKGPAGDRELPRIRGSSAGVPRPGDGAENGAHSPCIMESAPLETRTLRMALPMGGASTRLSLGRREFVLERRRGGYALLSLDGSEARTWWLGLPREGELEVHLRVPRLPLRLSLRETLVLAPGGRVRGYVAIPLVPTLCWRSTRGAPRDPGRAPEVLAELLPTAFEAEWDDATGECIQRAEVALLQRLLPPSAEPQAVVPLVVSNAGEHVHSPGFLPLALRDDELRRARGHWLARARRLRLDQSGRWTTAPRPLGAEVR